MMKEKSCKLVNQVIAAANIAALVSSTRTLCAEAEKLGMTVELEVFDYDVDKKSLIGPTLYAKKFAEELKKDYNNFGLLIDLSHFPLIHEGIAESILPVRDLITHVHIGNAVATPGAVAYGDAHLRFGFPGSANGMAELVEFLRTPLEIGFLLLELSAGGTGRQDVWRYRLWTHRTDCCRSGACIWDEGAGL